jgi:hypothetical protein
MSRTAAKATGCAAPLRSWRRRRRRSSRAMTQKIAQERTLGSAEGARWQQSWYRQKGEGEAERGGERLESGLGWATLFFFARQ